jgi:hypothetical protein
MCKAHFSLREEITKRGVLRIATRENKNLWENKTGESQIQEKEENKSQEGNER